MSVLASPPKCCDLCDGEAFDLLADQDRRGDVLFTGICQRCGLVCHMEVPSDTRLADFYASAYRQQYHGETHPSARRVLRAWKNGSRILREAGPYVGPRDEVLEIGAGIGCTVKQFELAGHRARGIEPHEGFQRYSQERLRVNVTRCGLFELPAAVGKAQPCCDFVLLVHVIEHFNSPRRALEAIHRLLRPGGRLYVECPNLAAPFATRRKLFHFAHIHNFTPWSLAMLAGRCGFDVERRLSTDGDPNLRMVLRRSASARFRLDPESHDRTLAALSRYNLFTYHLRPGYLARRAVKLAGYVGEHLFARRAVRKIEARCQASSAAKLHTTDGRGGNVRSAA